LHLSDFKEVRHSHDAANDFTGRKSAWTMFEQTPDVCEGIHIRVSVFELAYF